MKKKVRFQNKEYNVEIKNEEIIVDDKVFKPDVVSGTDFLYKVNVDNHQFTVELKDNAIFIDGEEIKIDIKPYISDYIASGGVGGIKKSLIKAPIPGKLVQVLRKEGDRVEKEEEILILEAMKMRNRILSPIKGIIMKVYVEEGSTISQDQELVLIESE